MPAAAAKAADLDAGAKTGAPAPASGRKKKLVIMVAAVALLLLAAGGSAAWWLSGKPPGEIAEGDEAEGTQVAKKAERHGPPTFAPLDPFTVNLADREAERFAQVGVALELEDAKDIEAVKQYMPAIRNNILMVLAHKTSAELLGREGKTKLADDIRAEALRALGVSPNDPDAPVRAVQFSNFIIQ